MVSAMVLASLYLNLVYVTRVYHYEVLLYRLGDMALSGEEAVAIEQLQDFRQTCDREGSLKTVLGINQHLQSCSVRKSGTWQK